MSSREYDRCTRSSDAGRSASERPGRHAVAGRMGRGSKPPPQLGHTSWSSCSTQSAQKVHSKVQMRALRRGRRQVLVAELAVRSQLEGHGPLLGHALGATFWLRWKTLSGS